MVGQGLGQGGGKPELIDRWAIQIEVAGDSVLSRIAPSGGSGSERHRPSGDAQVHFWAGPLPRLVQLIARIARVRRRGRPERTRPEIEFLICLVAFDYSGCLGVSRPANSLIWVMPL